MKPKLKYLIILALNITLLGCVTPNPTERPAASPKPPMLEGQKAGYERQLNQFMDYILPQQLIDMPKKVRMPVGAQIVSRHGKVPLLNVLKELTALKGYRLEAAKDVDLKVLVEVNVTPEDDFFTVLKEILSPFDYTYKVAEEKIIVQYMTTKKYHLPVPMLHQEFSTSLGGDLLGGGGETAKGTMKGAVEVVNKFKEPLDFWKAVEDNLTKIVGKKHPEAFFIIDKPLGIITLTAPISVHEKVEQYLNELKNELFKQVVIEAKIIEVILDESSKMGIDWSNLASTTLSGTVGQGGILYFKRDIINQVTIKAVDFNIVLGALQKFGESRVLSSPRITLMNGQSATLTVGENIRFIDKVETTSNTQTQTVTYSVSTSSILSGIGVAVTANIIDDKEVILYIAPITSELREPIEYRTFGAVQEGTQVGLPRVKLKEMATLARLRQGEALLLGGLIDKAKLKGENRVPILGHLPLIGNLFRYEASQEYSRELVIMIKPTIVTH